MGITFIEILIAPLLAIALVMWLLPTFVAKRLNRVGKFGRSSISTEAQAIHQRLFVADLHADFLLWNRDLFRRGTYGHVDLPRLQEGNVALQVFASVTKVPFGINFKSNNANSDMITLLAVTQGWPVRTWTSVLARALYMAERLHGYAARSNGKLMIIKTASDLDQLVVRRKSDPMVVGALLALEGIHALEGRLDNLDALYDAGFRMIGLHHFFDNDAGGSAHGVAPTGLTQFGRDLVGRIQEKKMALDLAHSAPAVVADALKISTHPVFVSHTGLRGTADNQRNLSDDQARAVAANGGVMGIALFEHAVGGKTVDDTARAMRYGADLVGAEHIALGSDFDGAIGTSIDASGLGTLTESLMRQNFSEAEIAQIMGSNVLRVLKQIMV